MEDQEFVIKSTVDGLIKVLEKDFDMSYDEAKFFVYIMVNQHSGETVNTISKEELNVWYLSEEDKYEGQIFNTHLVINFTSVVHNLFHTTYLFLVKWIFSRNIDLVILGANLVSDIASAITKIKDTDYCVYSRIIELCIGNKERIFDISDIKTKNKDGKCDYQEEENCVYFGSNEDCTCNEEKILLSLSALEKQGIIRVVGDRFMLI